METLTLIAELEELIDRSANVPLTGRCMVDKEELLDIIEEVKIKLPDDLKQAKWVKEERQRIIDEASKEAAAILRQAEEKTVTMVDDHEITKRAMEQATLLIENAKQQKNEIRASTLEYTESILEGVETSLFTAIQKAQDCLNEIKRNRRDLVGEQSAQ